MILNWYITAWYPFQVIALYLSRLCIYLQLFEILQLFKIIYYVYNNLYY